MAKARERMFGFFDTWRCCCCRSSEGQVLRTAHRGKREGRGCFGISEKEASSISCLSDSVEEACHASHASPPLSSSRRREDSNDIYPDPADQAFKYAR